MSPRAARKKYVPSNRSSYTCIGDRSVVYYHLPFAHDEKAQMNSSSPRAGWEKVGDEFYRKIQLYESIFDPDLELENYLVAGAPFGGAIGTFLRDPF
jgi:Vps16, N-terminal region